MNVSKLSILAAAVATLGGMSVVSGGGPATSGGRA